MEAWLGYTLGKLFGVATDPVVMLVGLGVGVALPRDRKLRALGAAVGAGVVVAVAIPVMTADFVIRVGGRPVELALLTAPYRIVATAAIAMLIYVIRSTILRGQRGRA